MEYIDIIKGKSQIACVQKGKYYQYYLKDGKEKPIEFQHEKSPTQLGKRTDIVKLIISKYSRYLTGDELEKISIDEEYLKVLTDLEKNLNIQQKAADKEKEEQLEQLREEYIDYYTAFMQKCREQKLTPLQYMIRVFEGCGVGAEIEMFKAFCGCLQTFMGLKGTNVIGVGSQSSGKTHCIENPLKCIPEEFVHKGTYSKASFFKTFNTKKEAYKNGLTGHIFYLGDLGGVNDNENTIETRDILKQLSSDGYAKRSLVDDEDPTDEEVTGYPAIVYTTVSEEIINEQEMSRSVILTPPEVDQRRLMIYDSFMESPGELYELKEDIEYDLKCIKGFVWYLAQSIKNVEMFNPFMFCVERFLANMPDFNRKIKEFNMELKIICILNDSFSLEHNIYKNYDFEDEEDFDITTKLYIASKQDVIDALTLFEGSTGLLPSELSLTKALVEMYSIYDVPEEFRYNYDEDVSFEKLVIDHAVNDDSADIVVESDDNGEYLEEYNVGYQDTEGNVYYCFFTIDEVRRGNSNRKWYRDVNKDLSKKLYKLYSLGILINIGKNHDGKNIYGINENVEEKITNVNPLFAPEDIKLAKQVFEKSYPQLYDEFEKYVGSESKKNLKNTNFEIKGNHLYELIWNTLKV